MSSEKITLTLPDGSQMQTYVMHPKGKPKAGIILIQEAFGVTAHIRRCVARFAEEGYLVIAPEIFHRTAPAGAEFAYDNFEVIKPHYMAITPEGLQADLKVSFDWLKSNSVKKFGSVGYCLGGRVSYTTNSFLPMDAAVSYYGRIAPDLLDKAKDQHGPILLFWGGADKGIALSDARSVADALRSAQKPYTHVEFSQAEHGFNCDDRPSFNAEASEQAWGLTLAFFKNHLG